MANRKGGIRRTIKLYGILRDPREEARRRRQHKGPIRLPHSSLITSVKPVTAIKGHL